MKTRAIIILLLVILLLAAVPAIAAQPDCITCLGGIAAAEIAAYPEPEVEVLPVDTGILYDRWYQRVNGTVQVYDAPNGNPVRVIDGGFNFVTALGTQDGWTQINPGEWVQSAVLADSSGIVSHFSGVLLPSEPLPYPMAWALINLYPSRTPGGDPSESNRLVYRYTRLNLYASVQVDGATWYQVGVDEWVHQHHVAKIIPVQRPSEVDTDRWISIDLYEQVLVAYEGDQPVFATLVASGQSIWPTNEGLYHIYFRRTRKDMSGGKVGDDYYYLEEVPWTMFFDEGRALHGAYWHDGFGYRRSHGCVNLAITDAHWLYNWVAEVMDTRVSADKEDGPAVFVYSSGQY
ncbi:MAG: L,D-transpeptidase [Chloroflexi bacterium]|nr:L,D-transpeptidase [Chloroflexota bacterium]